MWKYKRVIQVDIVNPGEETSQAVAKLEIGPDSSGKSYIYQMWADVEVRDGLLTIADSGVDFLTAEADACDDTRSLVSKFNGTKLDHTYLWRISKIFGRSDGCQHLYELALEISRAYSNLKVGEYINAAEKRGQARAEAPIDFSRHCAGLSSLASTDGTS